MVSTDTDTSYSSCSLPRMVLYKVTDLQLVERANRIPRRLWVVGNLEQVQVFGGNSVSEDHYVQR